MKTHRILVSGAGGVASMNFIKALRQSTEAKYYIVGMDTHEQHLQCSKDCDAGILSPRLNDALWLEQVLEIVCANEIEFIHFQSDAEVYKAAQYGVLKHLTFMPNLDTIVTCANKLRTAQRLRNEAAYLTESSFNAISTARKWIRATRGAGSRAALPVSKWYIAAAWRDYWLERDPEIEFMVAPLLPGRDIALQVLFQDGEVVCTFARERLEYVFGRQMPSGQSSSPSIAISLRDLEAFEIGIDAVRSVDRCPHGVFGIDMKQNESGRLIVTEINAGRFYTTSDFSAAAGCNIPDAYVRRFFDPAAKVPTLYAAGLTWVRGIDREPRLCT